MWQYLPPQANAHHMRPGNFMPERLLCRPSHLAKIPVMDVQSPDPLEAQIPTHVFLLCVLFSPFPSEACCQHMPSSFRNSRHPLFATHLLSLFLRSCVGLCSLFQGLSPSEKQVQQIGRRANRACHSNSSL